MTFDKAGIDLAGQELRMRCDPRQKLEISPNPEHRSLGEGAAQMDESRRTIFSPGNDLGDHRIVERRHRVALPHTGIDPGEFGRREAQSMQGPGLRQKSALRILGIEPCLDRMPVEDEVLLAKRERLAGSDPDCHSTRSSPVTASVTGCSTWRRVFISMK